jgi:hypothetical protein
MDKKHEITTRLAVMSGTRLFGQEQWLVDREVAIKLDEALQAMGLYEQVSANTFRNTTLGKEVDVDLHMVFIGLSEPWEMIHVLEEHGLLDEDEVDHLFDLLQRDEEHYEPALKARVQQAYRNYHKATLLH